MVPEALERCFILFQSVFISYMLDHPYLLKEIQ